MKLTNWTALALLLAAPAMAQDCPVEGNDAPLALHQAWIMEGWERNEGDPDFVFTEKMARWYDLEDPDGVFYDNFAPGDTQLFTDALEYGTNWEEFINGNRTILHGLTDAGSQVVSADVASTTQGFVGMVDRLNGDQISFDARSQIGWACVDGAWKIRQELNYAWIVEPESIAAYYENGGTGQ